MQQCSGIGDLPDVLGRGETGLSFEGRGKIVLIGECQPGADFCNRRAVSQHSDGCSNFQLQQILVNTNVRVPRKGSVDMGGAAVQLFCNFLCGDPAFQMGIQFCNDCTITFTGEIDHTGEEKLAQATEVRELYTADGLSAANKLARKYGFSNYYHAYGIVRRSKYGATRDFEISVFTLGGISFVIAPSEMFSSHGEYIKENTPGVTFVLTSANGKVNYIPNTKAYDYSCYERHAGYFTRETGDILAQTYVDMLNQLTN